MAEKLSGKALAWLTLLRDSGPQSPKGRGNMPCSMRRKGLTEFEWRLTETDEALSTVRIDEMFLAGRSSEMTCGLDRLTPAGRAALEPRDER